MFAFINIICVFYFSTGVLKYIQNENYIFYTYYTVYCSVLCMFFIATLFYLTTSITIAFIGFRLTPALHAVPVYRESSSKFFI